MKASSGAIPGAKLVMALLAGGLAVTVWLAWERNEPRRPLATNGGEPPALADPDWPVVQIDVNTATEAELTLLPGIGPALAGRIVEDRQQNGPFATLDDLQRVHGIGPRTVERLGDIAVAGTADTQAGAMPDSGEAGDVADADE